MTMKPLAPRTLGVVFATALFVGAGAVHAQTVVTLVATDTDSINDVTGTNLNDNRLRAYWNNGYYDGFMKFDFSVIPSGSIITAMTLRTYHELGFSNPVGGPSVRIYRVSTDTWSRASTIDPHPGLNEILTLPQTGFPSADLTPVDWALDVNAANWSVDQTDGTLSLAMRNENGAQGIYSYVYFYGSNAAPAPPELKVTFNSCATGSFQVYGSGCPSGSGLVPVLSGTGCPGAGSLVSLDIQDAPGNANAFLLFGLGQGSAALSPACALQILPLLPPMLPLTLGSPGSTTSLPGVLPLGITGPLDITFQTLIADPSTVSGFASTNPLKMHVN